MLTLRRSAATAARRSRTGLRRVHKPSYLGEYRRSLEHPEWFWSEAAHDLEWFRPWDSVMSECV